MEKKKKIDLHLVLKYGRPLICFILVFVLVFCYVLNVSADNVTFQDYYNIPDEIYDLNYALDIYSNLGYNVENLNNLTNRDAFLCDRTNALFSDSELGFESIKQCNVLNTASGYNLLGRKIAISYYSGNVFLNYFGYPSDYNGSIDLAIIDGNVCSSANNRLIVIQVNLTALSQNSNVSDSIANVTTYDNVFYSSDGLYKLQQSYAQMKNIIFTDMPIYFSSTDGVSGFTSYSTFNFNDTENYFDFNITGVIEDDTPELLGQYYNYAYVDGYIRPTSETDIGVNLSFSFNDYMRLHPNEYEIRFQWYATLTGNNLPSAYGSNYFESVNSLPLSTITGYNGWNQGGNNSQFRYSTTVNSLKNSSDKSLKDAFEQIYIQGGGTANTYNGFSIIDFVREYYTGLSSETVGKWVIRGNFISVLTKITLGCKISIVWVGGEPESTGGKLWITYDTENGSSIVSNDLGVNYNPPAEYSPQYPPEISDSNGNVIVNSGGSNITVNPTTYSNFNAIIEYLYHIDADEFLALAGNNQNAIQYALNTLSSTESNGFFPVLKRTFDIIPDQIWNWIKVSFAVILGGAILGISYRMVRWR